MSLLRTLADIALATTKISEVNAVANIAPAPPPRNLPANAPQPTVTPTAAEARARLERKLNTPALPARPGAAPQAGGGPVNMPFVCSATRKNFVLKFHENRYSGRLSFQAATAIAAASDDGPAVDLQHFRLDAMDWSGAQCPHCSASFTLGPILCGCGRYACRGGMNDAANYFTCACGRSGPVMGGLETINGAKPSAPITAAQPVGPLLSASKPVAQLSAPPPLKLPKG
jgi:hypothetical protein